MREGNLYFWRWKDESRHADCGPFRSYHCYSRIAIVKDGNLLDTYWTGGGRKPLDPDAVLLSYQGNINEMTEIQEYELPYYRPEDIVDTRHPNNGRAPIYLKPGAEKDALTMQDYARRKREEAEREIRMAERQIERMDEIENLIIADRLDEVHF